MEANFRRCPIKKAVRYFKSFYQLSLRLIRRAQRMAERAVWPNWPSSPLKNLEIEALLSVEGPCLS